jgi:hypothetical protein
MYKQFKVVRNNNEEELESFSTIKAAEEFMIMMSSKGESVRIVTDKDDVDENSSFDIEGLEIEEPEAEFGSALDAFNEDSDFEINNNEELDFDISD